MQKTTKPVYNVRRLESFIYPEVFGGDLDRATFNNMVDKAVDLKLLMTEDIKK